MVYVPELDRQGFADRQRLNREANRPAINFNQRDDMRDFARSGHGQNYNRMMDIQRQLPSMDRSNPMVQEFKDRRRTFNRYGKNPMGEMLGYTPQQMQDQYMDLSRDVRQTNKPVYNKMYPLTGGFMDIAEKGGILGAILSEIGNMSRDKGLPSMVDDSEEEVANYINNTFKPNMADVPTREEKIQALVDEEKRKIDNFETNAYSDILDDAIENQWPTIQGEMDDPFRVNEEMVFADVPENIEPLPFNDNLREAGIMAQYGQGPKYANNSMNYLNEYKKALASGEFGYDTPGGMMSYDEFVENYERLHSLPRGLHLGE